MVHDQFSYDDLRRQTSNKSAEYAFSESHEQFNRSQARHRREAIQKRGATPRPSVAGSDANPTERDLDRVLQREDSCDWAN